MAILRNPMLSLIICVIVGGAYLSWYTDMGGPIVQVAKASAIEFWKQMLAKLKNYGWDLEPLFDGSLIRQAEARIKNIIHEPAQQVEEEPIKMEDMKIDRDSE